MAFRKLSPAEPLSKFIHEAACRMSQVQVTNFLISICINYVSAFKSCSDAMKNGIHRNETVQLSLADNRKVAVYCDMVTDGGGWIVFQKRTNHKISFERDWQAYENGFGDLDENFWLGLKTLHSLTVRGNWTLRVELQLLDGERGYAEYTNFAIGSKEKNYTLNFDEFSGNIGDGLGRSKGMQFSTYDNDNDRSTRNCAAYNKGGWWFRKCFYSNLNKLHPDAEKNGSLRDATMMTWKASKGEHVDVSFSEMKMRINV